MQYYATTVTQQKPNLKETEMKTIKTPNFTRRITKIIEEMRTVACIEAVDAEVIENILRDELNEYCSMLDGYYAEEYYSEISSAHDEGYELGYEAGYDNGFADGHSAV